MKIFNIFLTFLGGFMVAAIFYYFVVDLGVYLAQLHRETTKIDINNYYAIKYSISFLGFIIGSYCFYKILDN